MRRRALAAMALGMALVAGACGDAEQQAADLLLLPGAASSSGGGGAARSEAAGLALADGDAAATSALWSPPEWRAGEGLPELGGTAPAYRLAAGTAGTADAERLARLFGVPGAAKLTDGAYRAGAPDGPYVEVHAGAPALWFYSANPAHDVATCVMPDVPEGAEPFAGCAEPPPLPDLPGDAEARRLALDLLERAGVDVAGAQVEVGDPGPGGRFVTVRPEIDGRPVVGMEAAVTLGSGGDVLAASGWLGQPEALGDYPLAGTRRAIERMNEEAGGGGQPAIQTSDMADPDGPVSSTDAGTGKEEPAAAGQASTGAPGQTEPAPSGGSGTTSGSSGSSGGEPEPDRPGAVEGRPAPEPVSEPVPSPTPEPQVHVLTDAEVVLTVVWGGCPGDDAYLVPAYRFSFGDDWDPTTVAVADEYLAAAGAGDSAPAEPCPGAEPEPLPAGRPEPAVVTDEG